MNIKNAAITLYHEFSSPFFDTIEPTFSSKPNAASNRKSYRHRFSLEEIRTSSPSLDINATFSPHPLWATLPLKFLMVAGSIAILVLDVLREPSVWWMAYFSNWGWSCVVAYFMCSFGCGVKLARWPVNDAGLLVKMAWALFAISLPSQLVMMLMHYTLQFQFGGSIDYISIIKHGAAIPLLLFDGFVINRIPLRMKQFAFFQSFTMSYLAWSIAYAYSGLIMPSGEDAIYEWLDWKSDIHSAILLSLFVLVLVNPAVFVSCRAASRILSRRMQTKSLNKRNIVESSTADAQDEVDITHDIEEGDASYDVDVKLSSVTVQSISKEEEVNSPQTMSTQRDEDIEDLASFPEIIYDDGDANMSLGSSIHEETQASSAQASSRLDAYIGDVKKPYEDIESFPGCHDEDGNDTDYSFDKEGVDISFGREVSHASLDADLVSFPDLLAP